MNDEASWLRLDRGAGETLRLALERALREAIREGALRPGARLPSSRQLAAQLGVSRGVVTDTYMQLEGQGYLVVRPGSAPVVAELAPRAAPHAPAAEPAARPPAIVLNATSPEVGLFPMRTWLAALGHGAGRVTADALDYGDPRGHPDLRATLADHLGRTRGVVADPERIVIVQGYRQGMDLLLRALACLGAHAVAVEDPSMTLLHAQVAAAGLAVVAAAVDAEGAQPAGVAADAFAVTPAHQFPTGVVLSGERRRQLLTWTRTEGRLLVEDDYDAEFRYDREPIRAMQGLAPDRVAYIGTVSKTFAPAIRLGWVVVPEHLVEEVTRFKHLADGGSPTVDQLALERLIASGEYDRHVRRSRGMYRRRRDVLTASLARHLPDLEVVGITAGLHVMVRLPPGADDVAVAGAALSAGILLDPLSHYAVARTDLTGLVIGYGRIHEAAIDRAVRTLATAVAAGAPAQAEPASRAATRPARSRRSASS